jgi:hypothetical protein
MFKRHMLNYNHRPYKFRNLSDPRVALLRSSLPDLWRDFFGFGTQRGEERASQTGVNQIQQLACGASRHRVSRSQGGETLPECRISNSRRLLGGFGKRPWLSTSTGIW